jgi:hypothetical protein
LDATSRTILQLDFLRHGYAVLGDDRRAELLLDDRIAALRSEGDLHRVSQLVDAAENRLAGCFTRHDLLCHFLFLLFDSCNLALREVIDRGI